MITGGTVDFRSPELICLECGNRLSAETESWRCEKCRARYPIRNRVGRFVPDEGYASNFGFQWTRFSRTQLDSHTGVPITRERFLAQIGWPAEQYVGARVLDAGCGSGRFTEVALACGAHVVAVDYSAAADACADNLGDHPHLRVLQADVYALPFAAQQFDLVYCLGVLQHTPDPHRTFRALADQVAPGGTLVVDAYHRTWQDLLHPKRWFRPLTTRMDQQRLFGLVEAWSPRLLRISRALGRVPLAGRYLQRVVPVANYSGVYPLSENQLQEWAVLDTFDWFGPAYDFPQTAATLRAWFAEIPFDAVEVALVRHLTARGRRTNDPSPDA